MGEEGERKTKTGDQQLGSGMAREGLVNQEIVVRVA